MELYLNTSNVTVNLELIIFMYLVVRNLNTSNVTVNLYTLYLHILNICYLNTSNVTVNHTKIISTHRK